MNVVKRAGSIIFAFLLVLALSTPAQAIDNSKDNQVEKEEEITSTTVLGVVDDEMTLQRQKDGSFVGTIEVENAEGITTTTITATLTGNVASIANKYVLEFHWTGTAQVGTIAADTVVVKNASIFSNKKYLNKKDFSTSCYGATSGARSVGTFTIPVDVTKVRLKTTGLTAYFLDAATWYATPSINTTYDVN
jgi:hypothetical protein